MLPDMTATPYHDPTAVGGRRALAALIDLAVYLVAGWIVFAAMAERIGGEVGAAGCTDYQEGRGGLNLCAGFNDELLVIRGGGVVAYLAVILGIWFLYHGVLQGAVGATPGKLVTGLRVVGADGSPAGIPRAVVRSLTLGLSWLVFGFGFLLAALIGAILVLGGRDHQRVGDRLARTYVVRSRDVGNPPVRPVGAVARPEGVPPPPPPPPAG